MILLTQLTWSLYWTVIGIVYPIYYAINIAYDLWVYYKRKSKLSDNSNSKSAPFSENYSKQALNSQIVAVLNHKYELKHQQDIGDLDEKRTIDEILKDINNENMSELSKLNQF